MGTELDIDYVHGIPCTHVPKYTPGIGISPQDIFLANVNRKLGNNCVIVKYENLENKLSELDQEIRIEGVRKCCMENNYNECSKELNRSKITIKNKESEIKKWKIKYNECLKELNFSKRNY